MDTLPRQKEHYKLDQFILVLILQRSKESWATFFLSFFFLRLSLEKLYRITVVTHSTYVFTKLIILIGKGSNKQQLCYLQANVAQSGVWLLTAQKSKKRPGWWKGKVVLFWMLATGGGGEHEEWQTPSQRLAPCPQPVGRSFYKLREWATRRNSTVSSDCHLEIGH